MNIEDVHIKVFCETRTGQHVGQPEQCVKAKHIPTGITAWGCEQRNQHLNREMALRLLEEKVRAATGV